MGLVSISHKQASNLPYCVPFNKLVALIELMKEWANNNEKCVTEL